MATFQENIENIRGAAIYGKDVRAAIADGLEQADGNASSIITSAIQSAKEALEQKIEDETTYINITMTSLGNGSYLMEIIS